MSNEGQVYLNSARSREVTEAERRKHLAMEAHSIAKALRMHAALLDEVSQRLDSHLPPERNKIAQLALRQRQGIGTVVTRALTFWQNVEGRGR